LKHPSLRRDDPWEERLGLALRGTKKIVVLGVGNPDQGDDGAGSRCAERLKRRLRAPAGEGVLVIDAREVPENHTGAIRAFGPDLTVIVDAAAGGRAPGAIFIVDRDKIAVDGLSTHTISLVLLVRYLEEDIGSDVLVLGIQPGAVELGLGRKALSAPVDRSVKELTDVLAKRLIPGSDFFPG
jgi:hydrogenase maturation protease HycI